VSSFASTLPKKKFKEPQYKTPTQAAPNAFKIKKNKVVPDPAADMFDFKSG